MIDDCFVLSVLDILDGLTASKDSRENVIMWQLLNQNELEA